MNKHISGSELETPKVTTGALPASRKVHVAPDAAPDLRVPVREIVLSEASGEPPLPVLLHDHAKPLVSACEK